MRAAPNRRRGYTLIELLMVVALVGILASLVLTRFNPSISDGLSSVAQIVAADVANARGLAVANNSQYRLTFDLPQNRYVLAHSGASALLNVLPSSPFRRPGEAATQQTTDLDELPQLGPAVELLAVQTSAGALQSVSDLEFGPLGSAMRTTPTVIWLASGSGEFRRYLSITVDPITGLAAIGDLQAVSPSNLSGS